MWNLYQVIVVISMIEKYRIFSEFKYDYTWIGEYIDEEHTDKPLRYDEVVNLLNKQDNEINELQERNDRQAKRLDNLYQLILNRDYDGQEKLIKELEESERILQEEMMCYRW